MKLFVSTYSGLSGVLTAGNFGKGCYTRNAGPALLPATTSEFPMPLDDAAPDEKPLTFAFGSVVDDGASGAVSLDAYSKVHAEAFRGSLILTDGMSLPQEYDGDRLVDLEIEAPSVAPTVSVSGSGSLTGKYKWKYRYKCTKTSKVSGFSEPTAEQDITSKEGVVTVTGSDDPQVDVVEVFRNIDGFYNLYYYVNEIANPASTSTYTDNNSDDSIGDNVTDQIVQGKTFNEGRMWPVLRSFPCYGFVWYYGLIRMSNYSAGTVNVTNGDQTVTMGTNCKVTKSRIGQRFSVTGDTEEYRIISVATTTFEVYPAIVRTTDTGLTYEIKDDRDGRRSMISEAGSPGSVPSGHDFTFGEDLGDDLKLMFSLGGRTYAITSKRIYGIEGERTLEPWFTTSVSIVAEEGCCGAWAAKVIPGIGLVYAEPRLGIRVFDGTSSSFLGRRKSRSSIHDEWLRFGLHRKSEIEITHDTRYNQILVSYARDNEQATTNQLVFDVGTGEWVGPWIRRICRFGSLETADGQAKIAFGSDLGGLWQDHKGTRDGVASGTLTGTVTASAIGTGSWDITDSTATFYTTGEGLKGHPVVLVDESDQSYVAWIVANTATKLSLMGLDIQPAVGWTYTIGLIPWAAKTGYLGADVLGQNTALHAVRIRLDRGASGTVACAVGVDGGSVAEAQSGDEPVSSKVYGRFRVEKRASLFQIMLYGVNESELPKITAVELIGDVRDGERTDGD